jgi:hypothetical protein
MDALRLEALGWWGAHDATLDLMLLIAEVAFP